MAREFLDRDGLLYFWQRLRGYFVHSEEGKGLSSNDFTAAERDKLAGLENYALPAASADTLGGVRLGSGLAIDAGGVLSVAQAGSVQWADVLGRPEAFPAEAHTHAAEEVSGLAAVATSGKYADLRGAPELPTDNRQLTNGAGYQTAAQVESAIAGKGYQTRAEVAAAIAAAPHLKRKIVDSLPGEADESTIYMVAIPGADGENRYVEWMRIEGAWERVGDSDVDLTDYLRAADLEAISSAEIDGIVAV